MTVVGLQLYGKVTGIFATKKDAEGNVTYKATPLDFFLTQAVTFFYQMLITEFANTYMKLSKKITYNENHQYQKNYDDSFIVKMFLFNFFNYYTPMISIAFIDGKYEPIFVMLLANQGISQNWATIKTYINPIIDMKPKMDKLDDEYKETLEMYASNSLTPVDQVKCEKGDLKSIRAYQAFKNDTLYDTKADIIGEYMNLVTQFGFITLFSEIFPPASLCSFVCNFIQM